MKTKFITLSVLMVLASCKQSEPKMRTPSQMFQEMEAKRDQRKNIKDVELKNNGIFPIVTFEENEFDFGTIKEGEKVVHIFKFKNTGKADLLIAKGIGSCGCTVPEFPKEPVKVGESGEIKVSFNSDGKQGIQEKSVTIYSNTETGMDNLKIKANVTPKNK